MTVWILIALLSVLTLVLVALPLVRRHKEDEVGRSDYDLMVFKDQLKEVERDLEQGVLNPEEAEAARLEIKRRMLDADKQAVAVAKGGPTTGSMATAGVLAFAVLGGSFILYDEMGHPAMPDMPYASRIQSPDHNGNGQMDLEAMVAGLEERLEEDPDNLDGWMMLARSYRSMERFDDLVGALQKGAELSDRHPDILGVLGETLMIVNGGTVTDEITDLFAETLEKNPRDFRARYYMAYGQAQLGELQTALQGWVDLLAVATQDADWIPQVREQIYATATELGVPPITLQPSAEARVLVRQLELDFDGPIGVPVIAGQAPTALASAGPGPSAADIQAAQDMSAEDQNAMIQGMVQRLADRLAEEPDDLEGWQRLARAYEVLGEADKYAEARAQIERLQGN